MQLAALGKEQRLIGRLLGDDVLEQIGQLWFEQLDEGKVPLVQGRQLCLQRLRRRRRSPATIDSVQRRESETASDDRSHLEDSLLGQRQLVDARQHQAVQGVGQRLRRLRQVTLDDDLARVRQNTDDAPVAQGKGQLLGKEGIAAAALL